MNKKGRPRASDNVPEKIVERRKYQLKRLALIKAGLHVPGTKTKQNVIKDVVKHQVPLNESPMALATGRAVGSPLVVWCPSCAWRITWHNYDAAGKQSCPECGHKNLRARQAWKYHDYTVFPAGGINTIAYIAELERGSEFSRKARKILRERPLISRIEARVKPGPVAVSRNYTTRARGGAPAV